MPIVRAEPSPTVQTEVNFLLGTIEASGCEFQRNGIWYDAKSAQAHLRDKYAYFAAANQITTTEDFIEGVASKSSFTGQPYEVRCGDVTLASRQWLQQALARHRAF
jgi:hypothetical protein